MDTSEKLHPLTAEADKIEQKKIILIIYFHLSYHKLLPVLTNYLFYNYVLTFWGHSYFLMRKGVSYWLRFFFFYFTVVLAFSCAVECEVRVTDQADKNWVKALL